MEEILTLIHNNSVSYVSNMDNTNFHRFIKYLQKNGDPNIGIVSLYSDSLKTLHAQLNYQAMANQLVLDKHDKLVEKLVLLDEKALYHHWVNRENINQLDIIIITDSQIFNAYYEMVFKIWQEYENEEMTRLPRLVLLENNYHLINCVFPRTDNNSYSFATKKTKINYGHTYYNRGKIPEEIEIKTGNKKAQHLVLVPSKELIHPLYEKLHKKYKSLEIYSFDDEIMNNNKPKIFNKNEKERIIISTQLCAQFLLFNNLDYIYDCGQYEYNNQLHYSSKRLCDKFKLEAKKEIYRWMPAENYNLLNQSEIFYNDMTDKKYIILSAYYHGHNINTDYERVVIHALERQNLIKAGKIQDSMATIINSPLSINASLLVKEWQFQNLPLFPGLVLAVIIDNYQGRDSLHSQLAEFVAYFENKKNEVDKKLITILEKVVNYYHQYYHFEEGLFNVDNVMAVGKNIIARVYAHDLYHSEEKTSHIYRNTHGKTAIIDQPHSHYPEKFINLRKINNNKGHDVVLFYMVLLE